MISEKDVHYVAGLARIHLSDKETKKFTHEIENILEYIQKLEKLDVSDVKPTSHALPMSNVFRNDSVRPSLKNEEALTIAVKHHNGSFQVPKVIE